MGETTFARLAVAPPNPRLSGPAPIETGVPDSKSAMPESSHPPSSVFAAWLLEFRKNGNVVHEARIEICRLSKPAGP